LKIDCKGKMNMEKTIKILETRLKSFLGERKAVIRISGGLDSGVVAALCVRAIGKEKVIAVLMPYKDQDVEDGRIVADHLGIKGIEVNIGEIINRFDFIDLDKLGKGNVMARIRMVVLYAFANTFNGLVVGTGNKSEIEIGYFTKYGDGGVDVEPIGDLYKTEIFEMAKLLGIPVKIINKKPSAELWEGQTDEDELGLTYKELDAVLKGEIGDGAVCKGVQKLRENSEHKRKMPPIFKVR